MFNYAFNMVIMILATLNSNRHGCSKKKTFQLKTQVFLYYLIFLVFDFEERIFIDINLT